MESAATLPGSQNIEMIAYPFAIHDTLERGIKWLTLSWMRISAKDASFARRFVLSIWYTWRITLTPKAIAPLFLSIRRENAPAAPYAP
jgi:hypothetical protein